MPRLSVVVTTFNRATTVTRALDSVLAQTHQADEIVAVDDGSSDNTADIIHEHYPQVTLLGQENSGVSAARNLGIRNTSGAWIALLDSDDEWKPEKLERQLQQLASSPGYLLCHTNETWIRNGTRVNPMKKHRKHGGHIFQHCLPRCAISPSSVIMHRDLFSETGFFDESLPACEDYDLWLRVCARFPVLYIDEALITKYGGHGDQLSRKYWGMDRFRILSLERILADPLLAEHDRKAVITVLLEKIDIYLAGANKHGNNELVRHFSRLRRQYAQGNVPLRVETL